MSRPIPAGADIQHFDPELPQHRTWLPAERSHFAPAKKAIGPPDDPAFGIPPCRHTGASRLANHGGERWR